MHPLYCATTFAAAVVCLLTSLLLFARRHGGERSRVILAIILLFSVCNYFSRFVMTQEGVPPVSVISPSMLLWGVFMVTSYILYPVEVISPGWLTVRRGAALYIPVLVLTAFYLLSRAAGVEYPPYRSLIEMAPYIGRLDVWFRFVIVLFAFSPLLFIFLVPYTKKYSNTNFIWISTYVTLFCINITIYILLLTFDSGVLAILYYYVSVACSLGIAYMELFVRLIGEPVSAAAEQLEGVLLHPGQGEADLETEMHPASREATPRETQLFERLDTYMKKECAWRNPDLSMNELVKAACTNRTTLAQVLQAQGYESYTDYVNRMRIEEFIRMVLSGDTKSFQEAFFVVGFRSRATALRNFRKVTKTTPSQFMWSSHCLNR